MQFIKIVVTDVWELPASNTVVEVMMAPTQDMVNEARQAYAKLYGYVFARQATEQDYRDYSSGKTVNTDSLYR